MDEFGAMLSGPGRLRFIVQPIVAIALGIRDGRLDAAAARAPYFIAVLTGRIPRRQAIAEGARVLWKPLVVAIALDLILQFIIFRSVHLWHGIAAGVLLIALPYVAARGLSNRSRQRRDRRASHNSPVR